MNPLVEVSGFILLIFLGQALRRLEILTPECSKAVSTLVLNVTLPCAVLRALNGVELTAGLLVLVLLGLLANVFTFLQMAFTERRHAEDPDGLTKRFSQLVMPGYNVGTFAMPFTAGFLSPEGFLALCLFDAGNAVMCTGGTYAVLFREPGSLLKQFASIVKRLLSSFAILTYLIVAALSVTHTRIPDVILHIIDIPANANTFLAMIMIGMSVNLNIRLESLKRLLRLLGLRYLGSVLMGAFVYWCLPFSEDVRLGILLVLFAPLPAMGIIFSMKGRMNWQLAANLNTMSVLCSVVIMSALLSLLV